MINFDLAAKFAELEFNHRFLPYSSGAPSDVDDISAVEQYERANILFFSDSHIDGREEDTVYLTNTYQTIDYANNCPVRLDAVINGGDILSLGSLEKKVNIRKATRFFEAVKEFKAPFIYSKGNHDLNDWVNVPENVISDKDWGELYFDYAERKHGIVRQMKKSGDKSTWHYLDIADKKIRIVSADMQDTDKTTTGEDGNVIYYGGKSWYISEEQMNWIVSDALNFDDKEEKDWGVIFVMHQYPSNSPAHQNAGDVLIDICDAFNKQTTYSLDYTFEPSSFFNMKVEADFTRYAELEKKPHIICWLLGHLHIDKFEIKKGINLIWTANHCCTSRYSDARVVRIKGTSTQNLFDILNVDTLHRKIRVLRYGAGTNCFGEPGDRFLPDGISY